MKISVYCIISRGELKWQGRLAFFIHSSRHLQEERIPKKRHLYKSRQLQETPYYKGNIHTEQSTANHTSKPHHLSNDRSRFKMAGDLPITRIYRSASAPPVLPSVAAPVIVTLKQALEREVTVWARIRAQVSQRHQEYQDEKKREQDRVEKELLILRKEREAQEKAQAELEATFPLATAVSASVPITVSWGRQIEEWAQIRAQATERYQKYRLEREKLSE